MPIFVVALSCPAVVGIQRTKEGADTMRSLLLLLLSSCLLFGGSILGFCEDGPVSYRADIFKDGLTGSPGKHSFRLLQPGLTAAAVEEAVTAPQPTDQRSPLLGPLNQDEYFPIIEFTIKEVTGVLIVAAISVKFDHANTVANFVIPPFSVGVHDADTRGDVIPPTPWRVAVNYTLVDLPVPSGEDGDLQVQELPVQMVVTLTTKPMLVTTYNYDLVTVPSELMSGRMYDLTPRNASMLFKFLAKVDAKADTLGIWATRRSPIPDFTIILGIDGQAIATHSATMAPPGGLGLESAFEGVSSKQNSTFSMVIHFYEPYEKPKATLKLTEESKSDILAALKDTDGAFVDKASIEVATSNPNTKFIFKYYGDTKHIGVQFTHNHPIEAVMLSVEGENGETYFREEERLIPFSDEPFGWYYVIPTLVRETEDDEPEVSDERFKILDTLHLYLIERRNQHPAELMSRWLQQNGANVADVMVADHVQKAFNAGSHSTKEILRLRGLVASRSFGEGDVIATIPYRMLLTSRVVEHNEWCRTVLTNGTDAYAKIATEYGFQPDGINFMLMTFFAISQPNHPTEGINWRLYFDTFPKERPPLPAFYSDTEMEFFGFSPSIARDAEKMKGMWSAEYTLLGQLIPWVHNYATLDRYLELRSHVESRITNASGTLIMLPLLDFMNHDDEASVRISYTDESQEMLFIANTSIPSNAPLTSNYGSKSLSKRDFLIQFGFIPVGAIDTVDVAFEGETYYLSTNAESRLPLIRAVKAKLGDDDDSSENIQNTVRDVLQQRLSQLPTEVVHPKTGALDNDDKKGVRHLLRKGESLERIAERLLRSEREVLQSQLSQLAQE